MTAAITTTQSTAATFKVLRLYGTSMKTEPEPLMNCQCRQSVGESELPVPGGTKWL